MKKSVSILLVILAVTVMILPSCKKYEDGPLISFSSKESRLVNQWKIESAFRNDVEFTSDYKLIYPEMIIEFKEGGEYTNTYLNTNNNPVEITGTWAFSDDKTYLVISFGLISYTVDILKLKNDELWLQTTYGTVKDVIHYIPA